MLQTQQPAQLSTERAGAIAILTIDRPARRNALGQQLIEELTAELERADRDPATRVVILTGSAPGFCAGSDLKELAGMDLAGMGVHEARTAALARSIALMNKPVVWAASKGSRSVAGSCWRCPAMSWCRSRRRAGISRKLRSGGFHLGESRRLSRASARSLRAGWFGAPIRSMVGKLIGWELQII